MSFFCQVCRIYVCDLMYRVNCDTNLYYSELLLMWFLSFGVYSLTLQIPYCFVLRHVDCDKTSCGKKSLLPLFHYIQFRHQFELLSTLNFSKLVMLAIVLAHVSRERLGCNTERQSTGCATKNQPAFCFARVLATVLISVFALCYEPGLLFRGPLSGWATKKQPGSVAQRKYRN